MPDKRTRGTSEVSTIALTEAQRLIAQHGDDSVVASAAASIPNMRSIVSDNALRLIDATDALKDALAQTATLSAPFPPQLMRIIFKELLQMDVVRRGGFSQFVFVAQIEQLVADYVDRYPQSYPACAAYFFPFLRAMREVPGNRLCGNAANVPTCAVRQAQAGKPMTSDSQDLEGYHFNTAPGDLQLNGAKTDQGYLRRARLLFSAQQATEIRIIGALDDGRDLLLVRTAESGGGVVLGGFARCQVTAPRSPHASRRRPVADQQLLLDAPVCNIAGTDRLCRQTRLVIETGRAMRALTLKEEREPAAG